MTVNELEATPTARMWVFWLLVALLALLMGLYLGYEYASGQAAKDREALVSAHSEAMAQAELRRQEAQQRGSVIERDFLTKLSDLHIVNTTIHEKVLKETQKLVYTDCKIPDAGVDLLNEHIRAVNLRLVDKEVVK